MIDKSDQMGLEVEFMTLEKYLIIFENLKKRRLYGRK